MNYQTLIQAIDQAHQQAQAKAVTAVNKQLIILSEFFREFKTHAQVLAQGRSLKIQEGLYVKVFADPDLLKQILFNLLSNALRYSPNETPVVIGWNLQLDEVKIWVSDQGVGMDKETLSHAFEPFYQGENTVASGDKGIGLGLSLAKSMVEAHHGTIWIESEPGKGTTVYFTLPIK